MSIMLLGMISYVVAGLFVIMDLYQDGLAHAPVIGPVPASRKLRVWLLAHLRQILAGIAIVLLWPLFLAAEHAARKRFRMASYVDRDLV